MYRMIVLIAFATVISSPINAQSTLTLDSFDLGEKDKSVAKKPDSETPAVGSMEACLDGKCSDSEYKSTKTFTLDDVVNLGVIDREEVILEKNVAKEQSRTTKLASIDIEILFDYDSDELRGDQHAKLVELTKLLVKEKYSAYRFAFLGHTDARGTFQYNQDLSHRRAASVVTFVNKISGLAVDRLVAKGLGPSALKTPEDPYGSSNRRVQLVLIPVKR